MNTTWRKKLHKALICFLAAILLVFSYEVNKPKAVAPLVWGASILGGMIIEEAAHMGIKWTQKTIIQKKADDWAADLAAKGGWDFPGTNPYLNKDGSVNITPSARDRARVASFLAGTFGGLLLEDAIDQEEIHSDATFTGDPYAIEYFKTMFTHRKYLDGTRYAWEVTGNISGQLYKGAYVCAPPYNINIQNFALTLMPILTCSNGSTVNLLGLSTPAEYNAFLNYVNGERDTGADLHMLSGGLSFPDTVVNNVYQYPDYIPPEYEFPNQAELENKPLTINGLMPVPDVAGEITWTDIEDSYNGDTTAIETAVEQGSESLYASGDITTTTYNDATINNYYTDVGQTKTKQQVTEEAALFPASPSDETTDPVPTDPDGGELVPVDPVDRSMLVIMKESYGYFTDSVDTSLQAMQTVADAGKGIISYLDTSMSWLPVEWRGMFAAAFGLGVFAHFFRR